MRQVINRNLLTLLALQTCLTKSFALNFASFTDHPQSCNEFWTCGTVSGAMDLTSKSHKKQRNMLESYTLRYRFYWLRNRSCRASLHASSINSAEKSFCWWNFRDHPKNLWKQISEIVGHCRASAWFLLVQFLKAASGDQTCCVVEAERLRSLSLISHAVKPYVNRKVTEARWGHFALTG